MKTEAETRRTWAEISLDNIAHNMHAIRAALPAGTKFLGVVKADAYGHGAIPVARRLETEGADYLAVACLDEALALRSAGIQTPVLILGCTPPECVPELIARRVTQALGSAADAAAYAAAARACGGTLRVHIKMDTGMSRLGFSWEDAADIAAACRLPELEPEGIFTHFAMSDLPGDAAAKSYTEMQFARFTGTIAALEQAGVRFRIRHCANSGAVVNYAEMTALDMARPGILLYGYGDSSGRLGLRPCMRLMSRVCAVHQYAAGTRVSYGGTFTTSRETRMGVVPAGYADGLHRCISNRCAFAVPGGMAPQRGRICMDMCMIDLTDLPEAGLGSPVEIFGETAGLDAMVEAAGTITYELLCSVSRRVPRVYR